MSSESRKRARFHPYAFVEDGLDLEILSVVLDDAEPIMPDREQERVVDARALWTSAKLAVECRADRVLLEKVLPPDELRAPRAEFVLSCRCPRTYFLHSKSIALASDGLSPSRCDIALSARNIDKEVSISLELVRTDRASGGTTGFAALRGMRLATAARWTLRMEPVEERQGRYLDVRYTSFSDDMQIPSEYGRCLFYLHADPMRPVLFLNTDHELSHRALNSRGARGVNARVRDLALGHVEAHVWPELLMLALSEIATLDDALPWQSGALEKWLPQVYPSLDGPSLQLEQALRDLSDRPDGLRQRFVSLFRAREGMGHRLEKLLVEVNGS